MRTISWLVYQVSRWSQFHAVWFTWPVSKFDWRDWETSQRRPSVNFVSVFRRRCDQDISRIRSVAATAILIDHSSLIFIVYGRHAISNFVWNTLYFTDDSHSFLRPPVVAQRLRTGMSCLVSWLRPPFCWNTLWNQTSLLSTAYESHKFLQ
jgi:lysylphosphatidylglycerol synthetase-like protein (DUF2156 family)